MKILYTNYPPNVPLETREYPVEYVLQKSWRGYRSISWHPHYITTDWVRTKSLAINLGNLAVEKYYKKSGDERI